MNKDVQPRPVKTTSWVRRAIIYIVLLLIVFSLGFVPMWWKSRQCSASLSEAEQQLTLARMQNALASAAIDARRGDYESARQSASDFFTSVEGASTLSPAQTEEAQPLLAQRDGIITLLARGDPAAADRLSDLYESYREIMK